MHFHGLWMMPNVYPGAAVTGTDCKLVMSPRGMLDPWARSWKTRPQARLRDRDPESSLTEGGVFLRDIRRRGRRHPQCWLPGSNRRRADWDRRA